MRALDLKDMSQLDKLLAKPPDPRVELENQPPDEQYELLEMELEKESLEEMGQHIGSNDDASSQGPVASNDAPEKSVKGETGNNVVREGEMGPVTFAVRLKDFKAATKFLLTGLPRAKAKLDSADLNAHGSEVELVTTGSSSAFPAEIKTPGYARLPLQVFERIVRSVRMLRLDSAVVTIQPGEIRFAS